MSTTDLVITYRPALVAIAYRMTGQLTVSEDLVQEVLLKWISDSPMHGVVLDPKAYLAKSVINATLNYLAQTKRQRLAYPGVWLPEPVLTTHQSIDAQLDISYGLLLVLEKLTPLERAIFVLKESFDFGYAELAPLFDTTQANCRQLYRRAKVKIAATNRRFVSNSAQQQALLEAFSQASQTGQTELLIEMLKTDVVLYSDGGGNVTAARKPLVGSDKVALFLRALVNKFGHQFYLIPKLVNGQVALFVIHSSSQLLDTVLVIESDAWEVSQLYVVRNPDKLIHLH